MLSCSGNTFSLFVQRIDILISSLKTIFYVDSSNIILTGPNFHFFGGENAVTIDYLKFGL